MPVLDTNILIEKIRRNEEIWENITEVTVLEYPLS
jgi:predicted nucleic acid-binding protein